MSEMGEGSRKRARGRRRSESGGGRVQEWRIYCIRYIWFETLHVFKAMSGRRGSAAAPHSEALIPKPEREHKDFLFVDLKEAKQMVLVVYPSLLLSQGQT